MSGDRERVGSSCEQTALLLLYMNLLQKQRGCIYNKNRMHTKKASKRTAVRKV